ncbi:ATP-binding cassette domain-containing protein [Kibdelosporangium philippinense]|uniref:ATP-binding cassette domain-containing protein n=1 Tax=Kibdelosporangium philippinense TaxID=211113 RepID=A0ABS8ZA81_9PSEU|nr:ATP-binding cassette domain-containing protein [Kibdelosporangium philippinense]MCE7004759.1 ATP-binding cassette domain-containing protein [Kibdelosporangium philippinense]
MTDIVRATGLVKAFGATRHSRGIVAVDDVSFSLGKGKAIGLVGESGSGKSTLARMLVGLTRPDAGTVEIDGRVRAWRETGRSARLRRAREVQMVFQDPYGSLDRRLTVGSALLDVVRRHGSDQSTAGLMDRVGLASRLLESRPHQLSGGQRQRVAIAKALAVNPSVLVLDEATSALDVSVQAQILALLNEIRVTTGISLVFVSHDLAVVGEVTDSILVMYLGKAVEQGATAEVLRRPQHAYTEMLLSSAPGPDWHPERVAELRAAFVGRLT